MKVFSVIPKKQSGRYINLYYQWDNYFKILNNEIESLKWYANYYNKNFFIWNYNLTNRPIIFHSLIKLGLKKQLKLYIKNQEVLNIPVYLPPQLKFREGLLNEDNESAIFLGSAYEGDEYTLSETPKVKVKVTQDTLTIISDDITIRPEEGESWFSILENLGIQYLYKFPTNTVVFQNHRQENGIDSPKNKEKSLFSSYSFIPRSASDFYLITLSTPKSIQYEFVNNSLDELGSVIDFNFILIPRRYSWTKKVNNISEWGIFNIPIAWNQTKEVWTGSFPLLSNFYEKKDDRREKVFMDTREKAGYHNKQVSYDVEIKGSSKNVLNKDSLRYVELNII